MDPLVTGLVRILGVGLKPLREALRIPWPEASAEMMRVQTHTFAELLGEVVFPKLVDSEVRLRCMW
jgi:hypothetical protein